MVDTAYKHSVSGSAQRLRQAARRCGRTLRWLLGMVCLGLAMLGAVLPLVPGWPFGLLALGLLGARDPWLRRTVLCGRHLLRQLRRVRQPHIRRAAFAASLTLGRIWRLLVATVARGQRRRAA